MTSPVCIEPNVTSERAGTVVTLTIGDGERLNALRLRDWRELERQAVALGDDTSITGVVVQGFGGVFCSGSDLREWSQSSRQTVEESFVSMERAFRAVEAIPVPTVAFVEKVAAGAGCQLALACDLQVLPASARMGMPILRLGILTPVSFARRLTTRIGASRAKALLFGGELLSAEAALRIGLVTHAPPDDTARAELEALLRTWSRMPAAALRAAKTAVRRAADPLAGSAGRAEPETFVLGEFGARVAAFLDGSR